MANADAPVPSRKPIATARAVTVAEWEDGIPPEPSILLESHLFSLYLHIYEGILTDQAQNYIKEKANKKRPGI